MDVASLITRVRGDLTPAERRVADVVLQRPEVVAFGTVAELASEAGAGGATVLRLAAKLGFDGFSALQVTVQHEVARRLRPAVERIREPVAADALGRTLAVELDNVHETLAGIDRAAFDRAVAALAARGRQVLVLSGEASLGVVHQAAGELDALRPGVRLVEGNEVAVLRQIARADAGDVCLTVDLRRYERWVVDAARRLHTRGVALVVLTDTPLSPLAELAEASFSVVAAGAGPFDSQVGTLALLNALVTGVADRLRRPAADRLDRVETVWREADALIDP